MAITLIPGREVESAQALQAELKKAKLSAVVASGRKHYLRLHVPAEFSFRYRSDRLSLEAPGGGVTIGIKGYRIHQTVKQGITYIALKPESAAPKGISAAFRKRAVRAVTKLQALDEATLSQAVQAPTDLQSLVSALTSKASLGLAAHADALTKARVRGLVAKLRLLEAEGGTLSTKQVAEQLAVTRQAVDRRRLENKLLGLELGKKGYHYPAWQLGLAGLPGVLAALAGRDPWEQLSFFLNPNDALGTFTPLQALRSGKLPEVLRAAASYGEQG